MNSKPSGPNEAPIPTSTSSPTNTPKQALHERSPRRKDGFEVLLVVPARPEMWAVVRMTASALASRLDFTFEDVEDLRLAITELCGSCAAGADESATCQCRFTISDDAFEMSCEVGPIVELDEEIGVSRLLSKVELSEQILQATVDQHDLGSIEGGVRRGSLCKERVRAAN